MKSIKYYEVGGCVRDKIMGLRSKDIDYAVEAADFKTMLHWIEERGKVFLAQEQFWTVRAHMEGKQPADFVLCRKDGQYSDGRRPDSVMVGTLMDDLARRDFTMNAIAQDPETGEYIDPHGGRKDIDHRVIRAVGNARDRMAEDALRMLRAIRFAITKDMSLSNDVSAALGDLMLAQRLRDNVSDERKREELHKCMAFDTLQTLSYLHSFPHVRNACFHDKSKLWLMPTMRDS